MVGTNFLLHEASCVDDSPEAFKVDEASRDFGTEPAEQAEHCTRTYQGYNHQFDTIFMISENFVV